MKMMAKMLNLEEGEPCPVIPVGVGAELSLFFHCCFLSALILS